MLPLCLLCLCVAQMPLTKWNQIKPELIEMWKIVRLAGQCNQLAVKGTWLEPYTIGVSTG